MMAKTDKRAARRRKAQRTARELAIARSKPPPPELPAYISAERAAGPAQQAYYMDGQGNALCLMPDCGFGVESGSYSFAVDAMEQHYAADSADPWGCPARWDDAVDVPGVAAGE